MFIAKEENGKLYTLPTMEVKDFATSELAIKILRTLAKKPSYPKEIAKLLKEDEQKIYYHIRNLEKNGLIKVLRKEERGAALAKYYCLTKPSFAMCFKELEPAERIPITNEFLHPFIIDGRFNGKIIVGSPDPHGPERARSRDAYYAIDLGLFLGTFLINANSSVSLDVEMHSQDLKENLIIIGGPVINKVTRMINQKLPIRFDRKNNIYSSVSKKTYKSDDCGFIVKTENPYDKEKNILVIAGKRYSGTRAAILAFLQSFDELSKKNSHVVEGIDDDGDGVVDSVKILE
jgi:DNA-binding MarR family transcriptional regulator